MSKFGVAWALLVLAGCGDNDDFAREDASGSESERRREAVVELVGEALAARVADPVAASVGPAYSVELANGNRVAWFEVLEGLPIAVEFGREPSTLTRPMKLEAASAGELFSALFPTAELPRELAELDARQSELAPAYQALDAAEHRFAAIRLPRLGPRDLALDSQHRELDAPAPSCLDRSWCGRGGFEWSEARRDQGVSGSLSHDDNRWVDATSCVRSGSVVHRIQFQTWWTRTASFSREVVEGSWLSAWTVALTPSLAVESSLADFASDTIASQCMTGLRAH